MLLNLWNEVENVNKIELKDLVKQKERITLEDYILCYYCYIKLNYYDKAINELKIIKANVDNGDIDSSDVLKYVNENKYLKSKWVIWEGCDGKIHIGPDQECTDDDCMCCCGGFGIFVAVSLPIIWCCGGETFNDIASMFCAGYTTNNDGLGICCNYENGGCCCAPWECCFDWFFKAIGCWSN